MRILLGLSSVFLLLSCTQTAPETPRPIEVADAPTLGPYSSAVVMGDVVYLSGIVGFNAETKSFAAPNIEDQFAQSFANLQKVLAASGSDISHVIKVTIYLKNPADFATLNPLYAEAFAPHKPARTTVPGVDWGGDTVLIELDVIAALK